jgi:hypothetical protein
LFAIIGMAMQALKFAAKVVPLSLKLIAFAKRRI